MLNLQKVSKNWFQELTVLGMVGRGRFQLGSRAEEKSLHWKAVGQIAVPQPCQCILDILGKTNVGAYKALLLLHFIHLGLWFLFF